MEAGAARSQVRRRKFVKSNDPVRAPDGLLSRPASGAEVPRQASTI